MLKRLSALVLLVLSTACAVKSTGPHIDPPPPPPPATFTLFVHVCDGVPCEPGNEVHKRPGTDVTVLSEGHRDDGASDPSGNRIVEGLPAGAYQVCAKAQGFVQACADVTFPRPEGADVFLVLARDVIPVDRVHVDGKVFRDTSGAIWQYRGVTSFLLFKRYLQEGEGIIPYIDNRRNAGANVLRVLTTVTWGPLAPTDYTDDQFRAFLALVHSRGMRLEVVALASAQDWSLERQQQHVQRIVNLVADAGALDLIEVANEPFQNSAPPMDVMRRVTSPSNVVMALGDYSASCDNPAQPVLDYHTFHPERKDEWPRTAKDEVELRDGFDCGDGKPGFKGTHVPVVADEPMGADEVNAPGRRSNVPDDFYYFAATSALLGAGGTYHSEAGLRSLEPGPVQAAAELAFFAGMRSVDPAAQLGAIHPRRAGQRAPRARGRQGPANVLLAPGRPSRLHRDQTLG
jgi:hypothetical protein